MKKLLFIILLAPTLAQSQSLRREFREIKHPEVKTELFKASRRLQTAGALLGVGGGLLTTGIIFSMDADTDSKRTSAKIIAGSGGLFCLIGGVLLGNAGEALMRTRNDKKQIVFRGNSIVVEF